MQTFLSPSSVLASLVGRPTDHSQEAVTRDQADMLLKLIRTSPEKVHHALTVISESLAALAAASVDAGADGSASPMTSKCSPPYAGQSSTSCTRAGRISIGTRSRTTPCRGAQLGVGRQRQPRPVRGQEEDHDGRRLLLPQPRRAHRERAHHRRDREVAARQDPARPERRRSGRPIARQGSAVFGGFVGSPRAYGVARAAPVRRSGECAGMPRAVEVLRRRARRPRSGTLRRRGGNPRNNRAERRREDDALQPARRVDPARLGYRGPSGRGCLWL